MNTGKERRTLCTVQETGVRECMESVNQDSQVLIEQALEKIRKCLGDGGTEDNHGNITCSNSLQSDINAALSRLTRCLTQGHASEMERPTEEMKEDEKSDQKARGSDQREIEEYLAVLQQRCANFRSLLNDQYEEHRMEMRALARVRVQEMAEREREMWEKDEVLLSSLISVAVRREKVMNDLRNQALSRALTGRHIYVLFAILTCLWFSFFPQNVSGQGSEWLSPRAADSAAISLHGNQADKINESSTSTQGVLKASDLKKIAKLEKRVRKADMKKHLRVKEKAAKLARRQDAVKKTDMDGKVVTGGFWKARPTSSWSLMSFFRRRKAAK
ncbi:hypothetical protein ACEWY4_005388 [Coilia grayii]|uniref:Uncharacterized protein n=1 Tax=Coilia grayii TaxID=363190 RepID=A0ABD1KIE9_9TELE